MKSQNEQTERADSSAAAHIASMKGRRGFRGVRKCPLTAANIVVDYKDVKLLKKFLTDCGKIMPRRVTSVSEKKQKELACAVKRARFLALLPYVIR